jgi:post-segregation antitoxin (ccd killing protein)
MLSACYLPPVATLQVKDLPDDLHAALRRRAREEGTTLSALVTHVLRREVALPSTAAWLDELRQRPVHPDVDVLAALDDVRE